LAKRRFHSIAEPALPDDGLRRIRSGLTFKFQTQILGEFVFVGEGLDRPSLLLSKRSQRRQSEMAEACTLVPIQLEGTQKHQDEWCLQIGYDQIARSDLRVSTRKLLQESDYLGNALRAILALAGRQFV
jgi:hypothetical protein